ncbi:fatty acyl-AMP ligase [Streptomyces sp. P9(2023)]|uniref:fatty acyl-AMP ligase n=1 Tax=Streptomyces sp. P9(2023) TaxID=3064394 RepID=UPI0028F41B9E|nr:fatty acyl-AMP ligase [Streptomyces sp. P9(2023)]MDT9691513.1 fatty acyl-AMP ligase [Streptomyces sp. P9(2023)]
MSTDPIIESAPAPLPVILARRAERTPDTVAYVYLRNGEEIGERTTYRELHTDVRARAAALAGQAAGRTSAVLMYPNGLEFIRAWLACTAAGIKGAPLQVPTRKQAVHRLRTVADDAGTTLVLTTREVREQVLADFGGLPELAGLELVATDELRAPAAGTALPEPALSDVALLQYTSGSTGNPKGVMVTHANFWANASETDELWPFKEDGSVVSWLPFFHDMGLLLGIVLPLWAGRPSYLMGPEAFVRRPGRWLEALSRFGGTHAAAPNFAYDLCVRGDGPRGPLDLSRWRVAINGAEPVRAHTVDEFVTRYAPHGLDPRAMCPGYGLAEYTLKISGSPPDTEPAPLVLDAHALGGGKVVPLAGGAEASAFATTVMSCGHTVGATRVRIVDPYTLRAVGPDEVGEIWASGPCVAAGYIGREEESERTFRARIVGEEHEGTFLRTGDMGFVHDGEVYVTGRFKDLIIVKGRNHYPQDLEHTAENGHPLLRPASAAAFAVDDGRRESVVVVVEGDSRVATYAGVEVVTEAVREALRDNHRIDVADVVLIRRGTLPKTTSGKVRRRSCREQYESGTLARLGAPAARTAGR